MAWADRKAGRVNLATRYPVNLVAVDGTWQRSGVLLDVSATGARVEVEGSLEVLKAREFFLSLSSTGLVFRRCELVRAVGSEVGLRFIVDNRATGLPASPQRMVASRIPVAS